MGECQTSKIDAIGGNCSRTIARHFGDSSDTSGGSKDTKKNVAWLFRASRGNFCTASASDTLTSNAQIYE